jgi:hypothetical protein
MAEKMPELEIEHAKRQWREVEKTAWALWWLMEEKAN